MDAVDPGTGQGAGTGLGRLWEEDPEELYDQAPCGYLSALPDGTIVKVNRTFCRWTGRPMDEVLGSRFQDLEKYAQWFDYAIWAFFVIAIGSWVIKKVRKRRRAAAGRSDRASSTGS